VLVLIRERTKIRADARAAAQAQADQPAQCLSAHRRRRLHRARHRGVVGHASRHAVLCHRRADLGPDHRGVPPDPQQMASLTAGTWQTGVGSTLPTGRSAFSGYGRIGAARSRPTAKGVRHERGGLGPAELDGPRQGRANCRAEQACLLRALRRADAAHAPGRRTRNIVTSTTCAA